jgi:hypothetical protein
MDNCICQPFISYWDGSAYAGEFNSIPTRDCPEHGDAAEERFRALVTAIDEVHREAGIDSKDGFELGGGH